MFWFGPGKKLPLAIVLLLLLAAGISARIFFRRAPVIIVSDSTFERIYGEARIKRRERQISLGLFRRVLRVNVTENSGPDIVSLAVADVSAAPWAVLFPYRYLGGALYYRRDNPFVPVFVMGAPSKEYVGDESLDVVCTDSAADLLRAGVCAAELAGEKKVLVFHDELFSADAREALALELAERGFPGEPVYLRSFADYPSYAEVGCAIVAGPASRFLDQKLDIPVILFSWGDPLITPREVKAVFDDSPWALAPEALRSLSRKIRARPEAAPPREEDAAGGGGSRTAPDGSTSSAGIADGTGEDSAGEGAPPEAEPVSVFEEEIFLPSVPILLRERFEEKSDFRKIRGVIKENFQKK